MCWPMKIYCTISNTPPRVSCKSIPFHSKVVSISDSEIEKRSIPHPQSSTCITDEDMNTNSEALGITNAIPFVRSSVSKLFRVHNMRCHDEWKDIHVSPNHHRRKCALYTKFHSVLAENTKHAQHV